MRISRKLAAIAAFFVIAIAVAACGSSSIPNDSVASMAGNPVTTQAFNHWMYVAAKDQATQAAEQGENEPVIVANDPPEFKGCIKQIREQLPSLASTSDKQLKADCQQVFNQYSAEVMSFLIEGYWYQAQAYKEGLSLSNAQVEKAFKKAKKTSFANNAQWQAYLKQSGETTEDVLFQIRVNKVYDKLLKHYEKPVTDAAILAYFNAHKSEFGTQASRDLHLVRAKTQADAQAALAALNSGQSWDAVAKQYSEDASARANGGTLDGITPNEEEAAVNKAIFSSPLNKVVGPVKGLFGWYVLEVTKETPATHESLAKARTTIKSTLQSQEQTKANTKVNALVKKNWKGKTDCRDMYNASTVCSNYAKPKTTTTPSSTTPTSTATTSSTGTTTTGAGTATTTGAGTASSGATTTGS
jgi:foldase protein PrsA